MNPTLSKKLQSVLETRTDTPELLAALHSLSSFYGDNTPASRRNLAADIENRGLQINKSFLLAFQKAHDALSHVEADVKSIADSCSEITTNLNKARTSTAELLDTTEKLRHTHKRTETETKLVGAFLARFQPTPEQLAALQGGSINQEFFDALRRVHEIHSDCKTLLRTYYQKAGLEIMDSMAAFQDQAYQRVYRWVQQMCRDQLDADLADSSPLLREGVQALRYNPHLFRSCFDEVAASRRGALIKRFIAALTRGGPGGMPRPIDLHAHDPLRYAGDMLAWLHQAVAGERELIVTLFSPSANPIVDSKADAVAALAESALAETSREDVAGVVDHIFEGVCRTFKARADPLLPSLPSATVAWKLANLLDFYTATVSGLLGHGAALSRTLRETKEGALKAFYGKLKEQSEKVLRYPPAVHPELVPPQAVNETSQTISEIATSFRSSLVPEPDREAAFAPVLSALLDPALQLCQNLSTGLDPSDAAAYMINCIAALRLTLQEYSFAAPRAAALSVQLQEHMRTLVQEQTYLILQRCGLMEKLQLLQSAGPGKPLCAVPGMDPISLTGALRAFYASLFALGALVIPQCDKILDGRLRVSARQGVAQSVAATHSALYNAIMDPANGYDDPASILLHTPDQVKTLLNVD